MTTAAAESLLHDLTHEAPEIAWDLCEERGWFLPDATRYPNMYMMLLSRASRTGRDIHSRVRLLYTVSDQATLWTLIDQGDLEVAMDLCEERGWSMPSDMWYAWYHAALGQGTWCGFRGSRTGMGGGSWKNRLPKVGGRWNGEDSAMSRHGWWWWRDRDEARWRWDASVD